MSTTAIHHLNCGTFRPRSVAGVMPPRLVAHCLLVERDRGLALVDTGFGTADVAAKYKRLGVPYNVLFRPRADRAETALEQVQALGFAPEDVRDIVVTHLDPDHSGGLPDFPAARVHLHAEEIDAARKRATFMEKGRYQPSRWSHEPQLVEHRAQGNGWLGFESVQVLADDLLLIPLPGHSRGHSGVAVRRPSGGWFLHAGDAYFFGGEKTQPASCPPGLRLFQKATQRDEDARLANAERLRTLHASNGPGSGAAPDETVTVFCAHDAIEYDALAGVTD